MGVLKSSLVVSLTDRTSGPARGIMATLGRLRHAGERIGTQQIVMANGMMATVKSLLAMAGAYTGLREGFSGTIGAAMRFEDAMADIKKVVDFESPQQFRQMGEDVLKLSQQLGMEATKIAAIMAEAGQANIPIDQLIPFTEMAAKVAVAWDSTAGETGDALAKIKTALGLTVDETGLVADAINHLGNISASGAKDLLAFSRGLPSGKQAGFAAKETLAFGAAMISSGFQAEVVETSFRNMALALTKGAKATSGQKAAWKRLGMDHRKVAKHMQKDAVGTTLAVLDALGRLPKHEQGAIATALFGQEARAIPALLGNMPEVRRLLGEVADDTRYAGSAAREYDAAMERTSQTMRKLKTAIQGIGIGIGDKMLPTLNEWAKSFSDTLLTLDQRLSIFDKIGASIRGFMSGLGAEGDTIAQQFRSLRDAIFGELTSQREKVAILGDIFGQFRKYGEDVRYFADQIAGGIASIESFFNLKPGTIVDSLGSIAGMGFKLMLAGVGISMVASTIMKLGSALMFLSGMSTAIGILKTVAGMSSTLGAATATVAGQGATMGTAFGTAFAAAAGVAIGAGLLTALRELDPEGNLWGLTKPIDDFVEKHTGWNPAGDGLSFSDIAKGLTENFPGTGPIKKAWNWLTEPHLLRDGYVKPNPDPGGYDMAARAARASSPSNQAAAAALWEDIQARRRRGTTDALSGEQSDRSWLDKLIHAVGGRDTVSGSAGRDALGGLAETVTISGPVVTQPSGVQQVSLVNPPQPNVYHVTATVTVNEAADGKSVARQFAGSLQDAIASVQARTNYQAGT